MAQVYGRCYALFNVLTTLLLLCHIAQAIDCPFPCMCHVAKEVDCSGLSLQEIPSGIPGDTEFLDLSNNEISHIRNHSLDRLISLVHLDISYNRISQINSTAFLGLSNLEILNLDGNRIDHFVKANLSSLSSLRTLRLDNNRLLDLECSELKHLSNLTRLHLRHNKFTVFPDACFKDLSQLSFLDLSWNRFHLVCEHTFTGLSSLETLLLNDNHLHHSISDKAFQSLSQLKVLDLAQANLFGITNKTFLGLKNVVSLNLSDNAIKEVNRGTFDALVNLEELNLSKNPILIIPDNGFSHNTKLKVLKVNTMPELLFFYPKAFEGLSNLRRLESWGNPKMQVLHRDILLPLKSIEVIDFSNSGIESVHSTVVRNITSLTTLFLAGNPLKCSCALTWMKVKPINDSITIVDMDLLECESPENLRGLKLVDVPKMNLTCDGAKIGNHTPIVNHPIASSVELHCPVFGEPRPSITWVTPSGRNFTYIQYDPYRYWPTEVIMAEHVQNGTYHIAHHWHESNKYYTSFGDSERIHLLDNGNLYIDYVVRGDAGPYSCIVENSGGNDSAIIRLHLDYFFIRQVRDYTCFVGGVSAAVILLISIVFASIRACVEKCMKTCCKKKKSERKGFREILGNIDTYRAERMQTLRDNYHIHIDKIKDQCSQNLLRLRDNYHSSVGKIRDNCTKKIERVRTNYTNQKGRIKGFGSNKVEQIRDNYNSQMLKIREYGHTQLKKIHENYKLQQQHILKILELLNIENCKGVVDAECLRTESMLFDAQLLVDPDAMDTPGAVTPDNRSESDYMTAGSDSVSEVYPLDGEVGDDNQEISAIATTSHTIVNEHAGDANPGFEIEFGEQTYAEPVFFSPKNEDIEKGTITKQETSF